MCSDHVTRNPVSRNPVVVANPETAGDTASDVTLIRTRQPRAAGKRFALDANGSLHKAAPLPLTRGAAEQCMAATVQDMASVLAEWSRELDTIICPAQFANSAANAYAFDVITEKAIHRLLQLPDREAVPGGVHAVGERWLAARLKRGLVSSSWVLLDADNPPGMPDHLRELSAAQRLERLEALPALRGIASVQRVELRASSARVRKAAEQPGGATHIWFKISDPAKLETLGKFLQVQTALHGLSFASPRYSRTDGSVIGQLQRTVFDLTTFIPGRLVYIAAPTISDDMRAAGYVVDDADVRIVNEDGPKALDVSGIELPAADALARFHDVTGVHLTYSHDSAGLSTRVSNLLTFDTPIESRGTVRTFREWLDGMQPGDALRCEAPFRESSSEAAFIRCTGPRRGFVFDIGPAETYTVSDTAQNIEDMAFAADVGQRIFEA